MERGGQGRAGSVLRGQPPSAAPRTFPLLIGSQPMAGRRPESPPPGAARDHVLAKTSDADLRLKAGRRFRERAIEVFLFLNGSVAVLIIALIFIFLFREGLAAFRDISPRQFIGGDEIVSIYNPAADTFVEQHKFATAWQPVSQEPKYSLIPLINGSLLVALPATLISTLLGVMTGVYLAELASKRGCERS